MEHAFSLDGVGAPFCLPACNSIISSFWDLVYTVWKKKVTWLSFIIPPFKFRFRLLTTLSLKMLPIMHPKSWHRPCSPLAIDVCLCLL